LPVGILGAAVVSLLQWPKVLNAPLAEVDPELFDIIEKEKNRQCKVRNLAMNIAHITAAVPEPADSMGTSSDQEYLPGNMRMWKAEGRNS
jgi:glycine hydroxymethyltransferase